MDNSGLSIESIAPNVTLAPKTPGEMVAMVGLSERAPRATAITLVVTTALYAAKWPRVFFTENGRLKAFTAEVPDEEKAETHTQVHFAAVPFGVFAFAYFFL